MTVERQLQSTTRSLGHGVLILWPIQWWTRQLEKDIKNTDNLRRQGGADRWRRAWMRTYTGVNGCQELAPPITTSCSIETAVSCPQGAPGTPQRAVPSHWELSMISRKTVLS